MLFTKNFYSKSWFLKKIFLQNPAFKKNFSPKSCFLNFFFFEIMLFKNAGKTQNLRILRGKLNQNVIFVYKFFSKSCFSERTFSSKSCFLKNNFYFKIVFSKKIFSSESCFLKSYSDSKSDAL